MDTVPVLAMDYDQIFTIFPNLLRSLDPVMLPTHADLTKIDNNIVLR